MKRTRAEYEADDYINHRTMFITHEHGRASSLYYVTNHWVIRCSGHTGGGRVATTFIRRRAIRYLSSTGHQSHYPMLGYAPVEGEHTGHAITRILEAHYNTVNIPDEWVAQSGVTWVDAVAEIDAAVAYAQRSQVLRASREVNSRNDFNPD